MYKKKQNSQLAVIEKELCNFYEFCKEHEFTPEEMYEICKPLTSMVHKQKVYRWLRRIFYLTLALLILYIFVKNETISWHLSAFGRILLIKILPIWNWKPLFGETCLIENYFVTSETEQSFDCTLCEAIDSISVETDADPYKISELYLDVNVPVIITDGLKNWPIFENSSFDLTTEILSDEVLAKSIPCFMSTNMFSTLTNVQSLILQSEKFKKWFFHFQNCEIEAVKEFRLLSPRPYFLKPEISPIQYSWLLMSLGYDSPKFKKIDLQEKIGVFGQMHGSNVIKLTPRLNCLEECPVLETSLEAGEAILFSSLWDLQYKPNKDLFNVAVILEMY